MEYAAEHWNVALWNLALWNHELWCHGTLECSAVEPPWNVVFYWKVLEGVLHKVRITTSDTLTPCNEIR